MGSQINVGTTQKAGAGRSMQRLTAAGVAALLAKAGAECAAGRPIKQAKHADGGGLLLLIDGTGRGYWRARYRVRRPDGSLAERMAGLGTASGPKAVSLKEARTQLAAIKNDLGAGRDPVQARHARKHEQAVVNDGTFAAAYRSWRDNNTNWSASHSNAIKVLFENDVLPVLGRLPVASIKTPVIVTALTGIKARGSTATAHRTRRMIAAVLDLAIHDGLLEGDNPAANAGLRLGKPVKKRQKALLDFKELGAVLRAVESSKMGAGARIANELLAATVQRASNVIRAQWADFDLTADTPSWTVPRPKLKKKEENRTVHRVPLPAELAERLRRWKLYDETKSPFVFPSSETADGVMNEAVLRHGYRRGLGLAGKMSPHGWRAAFSSIAHDAGHPGDAIKAQMDHQKGDATKVAYDRGTRWEQRLVVMRWWWDELRKARDGEVIDFRRQRAA